MRLRTPALPAVSAAAPSALHPGAGRELRSSNQYLCCDPEFGVQSPDHSDRECSLAIEHLGNACTRAKQRFQVLARQPLLFHSEPNGLNWVGPVDWLVLRLVGVNQGCEYIQAITARRATP